jgi:hypothetical protein
MFTKYHRYDWPCINNHKRVSALLCAVCTLFLCHGCSSDTAQTTGGLKHTDALSSQLAARQAGLSNLAEAREGPRILLEKTHYDLGEIKPMTKTNATFDFRNIGNSPLRVTGVKSCCGVPAKVDKKELQPGETGILTAQYTASQAAGVFTKRILLLTNDPQNSRIELTIKGKVVQTLAWSPAYFKLSANKGLTACPEITIKSLNGTPFSVTAFAATGRCLSAEFDPACKATEFTLKPTIDGAKLNALSANSGIVRIDLDHPDYKSVNLTFSVTPALQVIPAQLLAFNVKADEPVLRSLQVKDNEMAPDSTTNIEIESVTSKNGSRVELRSLSAGKTGCELNVAIWPVNNKEKESFSADQLVIELKDGRKLTVPVRVFYAARAVSSTANPDSKL